MNRPTCLPSPPPFDETHPIQPYHSFIHSRGRVPVTVRWVSRFHFERVHHKVLRGPPPVVLTQPSQRGLSGQRERETNRQSQGGKAGRRQRQQRRGKEDPKVRVRATKGTEQEPAPSKHPWW
eukprot:TRINITY_DN4234_c0_g1_i1.p2 TRINITY_DN4234_c0_g1~~TRINITY_DN4234_c0_g1_i1.p2  ORF type:complete len:122 (-),score=0.25 TRINITY_DN4234_c0_g1_i1:115-480(-)